MTAAPAPAGGRRLLGDLVVAAAVVLFALRPRPHQAAAAEEPRGGLSAGRRQAVRAYLVGLGVSLLITLVVVLRAIDVQSALVPDADGHAWSFHTLFAPAVPRVLHRGWTVLSTPGMLPDQPRFESLLHAHLVVDVAFIVVYAVLLAAVTRAVCQDRIWRRTGVRVLALLVLADLLEDLFAARVLSHPAEVSALVVCTLAKWVLAALLVTVLVLRVVIPTPRADPLADTRPPPWAPRLRRRVRDAVKAVVHQRFSYAPVLAVFGLSVLSGSPILEQLPDAQRRWLFDGWIGRRQAAAAITCTALLGLFLLALGGQRTRYAYEHLELETGASPPVPLADALVQGRRHLLVWLVGPALAVLGTALYALGGHLGLILGGRTVIWVAVPLAIYTLSWCVLRAWRKHPDWYQPDRPPSFTPDQALAVGIAGTVAGVGAIVVGGLSLVRALVPLVVLPPDRYLRTVGTTATMPAGVVVLLGIAAAAIVGSWLVAIGLTLRHGGPDRVPLHQQTGPLAARLVRAGGWLAEVPGVPFLRHRRAGVLLTIAIAAYVLLGVEPALAAWLGLAATATWALGSLAGMLSGVGLVLQDQPTAEVFRLLHFRRTPLVTLWVVTLLLVSTSAGDRGLHAVAHGSDHAPAGVVRPTVDVAFHDWLAGAARCQVPVAGRQVRPMLMIAAEGGGIRASYWTVRSLQAIDDATCGEYSAFFSGGASGGSVGLTVARLSNSPGDTGSRAAVTAVKKMAEPATLSEAADGTFVRDMIYGATGVPVPRLDRADPYAWQDRATLIENGWVDSGDWGQRTFLGDPSTMAPTTGALVLNATSVRDNCRVWLSQLELPNLPATAGASFDPEQTCDTAPGVATRTTDLFSAYGPLTESHDATCLGYLSAPTAALLTARFPYVTPSGVVGPCPDRDAKSGARTGPYWPRTQLVDGGYIENTGLATVTDLADVWLPLVRRQNEIALADPTAAEPLVVPIVVYLTNGEHSAAPPAVGASPISELAVPPRTYLASRTALTEERALLGRARDVVELASVCPTDVAVCRSLGSAFPSRVVVVDRATQPEVSAPLGWVLSGASITSLDNAMDAQLTTWCPANRPSGVDPPPPAQPEATVGSKATCRQGYATLGDLQRYLTRDYGASVR